MKASYFFFFIIFIALVSCNYISDKPVSEELSSSELSKAIKSDTSFSEFYENIRKAVADMNDIKKAKYNEVTYRRLFKYFKFLKDSAYWNPLTEKWNEEWTSKFSFYSSKADSTLSYWKKIIEEKSLDKYVKIELAQIDKEYYEYIGGIKEVNLGFKLTPLQGAIDQIRFTYGYKVKINGDNKYYERRSCISTSPFSSPTIRFWEVGYSDKDIFGGKTVETFLRDYNLYIEITSIRKDGININVDDLSVPNKVSECFENEKNYPILLELSKEDLIKDLINKNFESKWEYKRKKADEIKMQKDRLCFDFLNSL